VSVHESRHEHVLRSIVPRVWHEPRSCFGSRQHGNNPPGVYGNREIRLNSDLRLDANRPSRTDQSIDSLHAKRRSLESVLRRSER
jgi:hypothetical protein